MTGNKRTVQKYMEGSRETDRGKILSCLTDDVEWEIPGLFHSLIFLLSRSVPLPVVLRATQCVKIDFEGLGDFFQKGHRGFPLAGFYL